MFKETYGFDPEVFKRGVAIRVNDSKELLQSGRIVGWTALSHEHANDNMTGTYIVRFGYPTELIVTSTNGEQTTFPIRHFIGGKPRMTVRVLN